MATPQDEKFGGHIFTSSTPTETHVMSQSSIAENETKDKIYKRRIRILRFCSRLLSVIMAAVIMSTLAYTLAKYYLTRSRILPNTNQHVWITPANVWPTILLLAIASISFVFDSFTMCFYICGIDAANKFSSITTFINYTMLIVKIAVWAVMAGIFKKERTGRDLWGYSCSPFTDTIHAQVKSYVNFGRLCTMQNGAWGAMIVEAVAYTMTFATTVFIMKRASHKKKLAKMRQRLGEEGAYGQQVA